jgi:hypothetical protein
MLGKTSIARNICRQRLHSQTIDSTGKNNSLFFDSQGDSKLPDHLCPNILRKLLLSLLAKLQ